MPDRRSEVKNANGDHTFADEAMRKTILAWEVLKNYSLPVAFGDGQLAGPHPQCGLPFTRKVERPQVNTRSLETRHTPLKTIAAPWWPRFSREKVRHASSYDSLFETSRFGSASTSAIPPRQRLRFQTLPSATWPRLSSTSTTLRIVGRCRTARKTHDATPGIRARMPQLHHTDFQNPGG